MALLPVTFVTPTYRNDLELAVDLCRSIDTFARGRYEHVLIVPKADAGLFEPLSAPARRIVTREDLLGRHGFRRLPIPASIKLPFLPRKWLHEQYWVDGVGRASGWLVQQIVKLGAADYADSDLVVFADSDAVLIRPLDTAVFFEAGTPIVQRHRRGSELDSHKLWRRSAHELIGVDRPASDAYNFIGQFIPWQTSIVTKLVERIEEIAREPWRKAIARKRDVSEYILYGEFASEVMDPDDVVFRDLELYRSIWFPHEEISAELLVEGIKPHMVALHIQSTHPISPQDRRRAIGEAGARLANAGTE